MILTEYIIKNVNIKFKLKFYMILNIQLNLLKFYRNIISNIIIYIKIYKKKFF